MADYHGIDRRMLRHIPIPEMTHDDDTCPHLVRANLLEAENARLKAEVERLTKQVERLIVSLQKSHDEHGEALYKLKYKNERQTPRKKRSP